MMCCSHGPVAHCSQVDSELRGHIWVMCHSDYLVGVLQADGCFAVWGIGPERERGVTKPRGYQAKELQSQGVTKHACLCAV